MNKQEKIKLIVNLLKEDSRLKMTKIGKLLNIPLTTIFDLMKDIKEDYIFTIIKKIDIKTEIFLNKDIKKSHNIKL